MIQFTIQSSYFQFSCTLKYNINQIVSPFGFSFENLPLNLVMTSSTFKKSHNAFNANDSTLILILQYIQQVTVFQLSSNQTSLFLLLILLRPLSSILNRDNDQFTYFMGHFPIYYNIFEHMGSIQSKLKDAYSVKQKPFFKKNQQKGVNPSLQTEIQSNVWPVAFHRKKNLGMISTLGNIQSLSLPNPQFSQNEHKPVQDVLEYPYCSVGLISFEIEDQIKYGTGCLISSNLVLTCAHNLYSIKHGEQAKNIKFIPAYSFNEQRQFYRVKKIYYPNQFKSDTFDDSRYHQKLFQHDYGILQLETKVDLGRQYGCLGFNFNPEEHREESQKCILGYTHRQNMPVSMYQLTGKVRLENNLINYDMPTEIGMSGAPIIDKVNGEYVIIGIHTYVRKNNKQMMRGGLRLHQEMFTRIGQWITQEEEEIDLRDKKIGKDGVKQLSKLKWNTVHSINLARNDLGKDGLKYFPKFQWKKLYHLDLGGNNIGSEGVEFLAKANLQNLTSLNLWGNGIGKEGVAHFAKTDWKLLNSLNLYNNQIGNEGLTSLIKMKWPELSNLNLGKNKIDIVGVEILVRALWTAIVSLNLWGNLIKDDKATSSAIKKHFPRVKFIYL